MSDRIARQLQTERRALELLDAELARLIERRANQVKVITYLGPRCFPVSGSSEFFCENCGQPMPDHEPLDEAPDQSPADEIENLRHDLERVMERENRFLNALIAIEALTRDDGFPAKRRTLAQACLAINGIANEALSAIKGQQSTVDEVEPCDHEWVSGGEGAWPICGHCGERAPDDYGEPCYENDHS